MEGEDWEEEVETMMTGLDKLQEFAICSIDELRDEEIRMAETTSFCLSEKKHQAEICQFQRGVVQGDSMNRLETDQ